MERAGEQARGVDAAKIALLAAFVLLTLLIETVFKFPFRATGHRAFPGALTLIMFTDCFGPMLVLPFAAAVPIALYLFGFGKPLMIAAWMVPAVALAAFWRGKLRGSLIFCVVIGLLFGLARFLSLEIAAHHMPDMMRLAGHLLFGGLGGLAAYPAVTILKR